MPNRKISMLPAIPAPLTGSEFIPISQAGVTYKITTNQLSNYKSIKVTIASAAVLTLNSVPVIGIAAPGVGYAIKVLACAVRVRFNSIAYTMHLDIDIYTDTANNVQAQIINALNASIISIRNGNIELAGFATDTQLLENKALMINVDTGDPLLGNSDIDIYIDYTLIKL